MLIILSPAKKLNYEDNKMDFAEGQIPFEKKTTQLINKLSKLSPKKIGELMKLSPELSLLNHDRYQNYSNNPSSENLQPAAFAFNGEAYAGLNIRSFSKTELENAQKQLRILSGLYGILKPLTPIQPYRLEMGTRLKVGKAENLYAFWKEDILKKIIEEEQELLINLASNEYNKAAVLNKFPGTVITPNFKEFKNGEYKTIMVFAKNARGTMTAWIIKTQPKTIEELKTFNEDGYFFNEELSQGNDWVFTRG